MPSGWAVLADQQFNRGYCILLSDPIADDINQLSRWERLRFLDDMTIIGDALLEVTDAFRINYSIMGNTDPALHAHINPRYTTESEAARKNPIHQSYSKEELTSRPFDVHRERMLVNELAKAIKVRL